MIIRQEPLLLYFLSAHLQVACLAPFVSSLILFKNMLQKPCHPHPPRRHRHHNFHFVKIVFSLYISLTNHVPLQLCHIVYGIALWIIIIIWHLIISKSGSESMMR